MGSSMIAPALPYGANQILALRKAGKRPAEMVLVSMIGPLREINPVIVANPSRAYDWTFLVDLPVLVVANADTSKNAVRGVLATLKALPARSLGLWLANRQNGQHLIVDGVQAHPQGMLRYMDATDRRNYAGIGTNKECAQCK
jgi:hypothetical protein